MNSMFKRTLLFSALLACWGLSTAQAATSAELEQLGKKLTPFGAERAGTVDGSIPAWEGGLARARLAGSPAMVTPMGLTRCFSASMHRISLNIRQSCPPDRLN